jgi:uroporphyrinogen decarboxylase
MRKITPKERVRAALNFEETDIVPYDIIMEPEVEDRLNEHYGGRDWENRIEKHMLFVSFPVMAQPEMIDEKHVKDEYGCVWDLSARPLHLVSFPLQEPSLEGYDFDAVQKVVLNSLDNASANLIIESEPDAFVLGQLNFGLFERSWTLRGFENVLVDCILNTAFYEELLDRILEMHLATIDRMCEFPIDAVFLGDDWGDQRGVIFGPERWRRLFKPRVRKLYDRIHAHGKLAITHCCGNIFELIPDLIEVGLDGLESLQPEAMNVYEIKRKFGKNLRLWGGLGTQQLLPFGTPQEVRAEIRRLISEMGKGSGYILAAAKPLMPEVPAENAIAVIEEFAQKR